jgi:hypothetical protein
MERANDLAQTGSGNAAHHARRQKVYVHQRFPYWQSMCIHCISHKAYMSSKTSNFCGCRSAPSCLQFRDDLYTRQMEATQELFSCPI